MKHKSTLILRFGIALLCLFAIAAPALAQRGGRSLASNMRDGRDVKAAFRSVVATANQSTVRVRSGGRDVAYGTVVGADGWILTKYSELREPLTCYLAGAREVPAKVVGYDPKFDLAMLKIDATSLKPVEWADATDGPDVGQFLATAAPGDMPQAIGVVSVPRRAIAHRPGVLGVFLDDSGGPVKIAEVFSGSGAEEAGLKAGDIITKVNDKRIEAREAMIDIIRKCKPLDVVALQVHRGDDDLSIRATLRAIGDSGPVSRSERMNAMGGPLSKRAADFPTVIQHDTVLRPQDCGGPVVDLSGKVVGINIARAGRTESYAVPTDQVRLELADLASGRMAPKELLPGAKSAGEGKETRTVEKKTDGTSSQ